MSSTTGKRLRTEAPARGRRRASRSRVRVDALPADVLLLVLRHCPRHEVATNVRMVNRHFRDLAAIFLNDDLRKLLVRYEQTAESLAEREQSSKKRPTHLAIRNGRNAFAVIHDQLRVAHAVTWRYLVPDVDCSRPRACFYGGLLLDLFWTYLYEAEATPILLTANFFYRGLENQNSEKCVLVNRCKRFLNHFEKVTEPRLLSHHSDFGAKVLDLLDCLLEAETSLLVLDASSESEILIKASYHVPKSFFTCLQVSRDAGVTDWKEECRFMFMRLRRIVSNSNANSLQSCRFSRARQWRCKPSVYSGFGTNNGNLFYYGCLNHTASVQRSAGEDQALDDVFTDVDVELKCPPRLAPFSLYRQRKLWNLRHVRRHGKFRRRRCHLQMNVNCPFSSENRLPESFCWAMPWRREQKRGKWFPRRNNF